MNSLRSCAAGPNDNSGLVYLWVSPGLSAAVSRYQDAGASHQRGFGTEADQVEAVGGHAVFGSQTQ